MDVLTVSDFLIYFLTKIVKKKVSLKFSDSCKNFSSRCTNRKSELGFVMPTGLAREALENILGSAGS